MTNINVSPCKIQTNNSVVHYQTDEVNKLTSYFIVRSNLKKRKPNHIIYTIKYTKLKHKHFPISHIFR